MSIRAKSFGQLETPAFSLDCRYKHFYTAGNTFSTNLLFLTEGERKYGVIPSYELLIQTPLTFGSIITDFPDDPHDLIWVTLLNMVNGEVGYRTGALGVGVSNAFHLYFTRRVYHQTGVFVRYGTWHRLSVSMIEQDRMRSGSSPDWGIGIGYQVPMDPE